MTIADSIAYPFESDSKYPYTADGNREFLDGKAFIESFVLDRRAVRGDHAGCSFNIFVLKLPIRPPALVAKQAGSLAALFDNRLGLGVGTSPWPEDYEMMGVPFAKRGKRMDECIDDHPGPDVRRLLRVPRRVLRHPEDQDDARADQADPDPDRRARRRRAAAGRPHATAGCTAAAIRDGTRPTDRQAQRDSRRRGPHGPVRDPRDVDRRLHPRRHQAPRGQGRHRRHRRLPQSPTSSGPDTEPLDAKIRNLEWFAENVIAKV